jgi:hypothetical protein
LSCIDKRNRVYLRETNDSSGKQKRAKRQYLFDQLVQWCLEYEKIPDELLVVRFVLYFSDDSEVSDSIGSSSSNASVSGYSQFTTSLKSLRIIENTFLPNEHPFPLVVQPTTSQSSPVPRKNVSINVKISVGTLVSMLCVFQNTVFKDILSQLKSDIKIFNK